jgi:hypothetical protein
MMVVTVVAVIVEAAVMMMEASVMVAADVTSSVRHRRDIDPNSSPWLLRCCTG